MKRIGMLLADAAVLACSCSAPSTTGSSTTSTASAAERSATLACLAEFAPGTSRPDSSLLGKSLKTAESLALAAHQTTRVVAQDGSCNAITSDLAGNRVDLWVINDVVVKAVVEGPTTAIPQT